MMDGGHQVLESPSSVHRLNTDCLTEIFYSIVRASEGDFDALDAYTNLLSLTHVCRVWRALALDLPELWGDIAFVSNKPDVFRTLLDRARDAPLYLPPIFPSEEQANILFGSPERFRVLERAYHLQWDPAVLAGKYLPCLESARLMVWSQHERYHPELAPMILPRIQKLVLRSFCIPFEAPNLRSLRITLRGQPINPEDLVSMLNSLPRLNTLRLGGCLPPSFVHNGRRIGPIYLPSLTMFRLRDGCAALTAFLEQLHPGNPDCGAHLTARRWADTSHAELGGLFQAMRRYLKTPSRDEMYMHLDPNKEPYIAAMRRVDSTNTAALTVTDEGVGVDAINPALERAASFSLDDRHVDLISIYASFLDQLSPSQVRYLRTHRSWQAVETGFPSSQIAELFGKPQFTNSLQVVEHGIAFSDRDGQFSEARMSSLFPSVPTLWPQLRKMTLSGDACLYVLHTSQGADALLSWLKAREGAGLHLPVLHLRAQAYTGGQFGTESAAQLSAWSEIRALVSVVDERKGGEEKQEECAA
ncbi:unnamed protein product [Peniophora sp. CBMAI 1063]|nr:unnamed protein product [Peniophora sp. CBMAI 1063]